MKKLNWKEKAHLLEVLEDPKKTRKEFWDLIEEIREKAYRQGRGDYASESVYAPKHGW